VSEERIAELAGDGNGQGVPLIKLVEEAENDSGAPAAPKKKKAAKNSKKESDAELDENSGAE